VARVIDTTTVLLIFWARAVTDMRGQPMFSSLIEYRSDTQASFNLVAESITTTDAKVYDIKLKKGWKFHDGTEVKAKNFVDAWNWGAYAPNGQLNTDFFAQIEGFDAVNRVTTRVLGDYEFQVTLQAPFSVRGRH
jgi:oligopeptide transport system substrate-binding protein